MKNVLSALKLNFILSFSAEADGQPLCVYDVGVSHVSMLHFFKQQAETTTRIAVKAVGLMRKDLHANQGASNGTSDRHTIECAGWGKGTIADSTVTQTWPGQHSTMFQHGVNLWPPSDCSLLLLLS